MYSELRNILPGECLKFNESMKNHTSFKIGGPADLMVLPRNITDIREVLSFARGHRIPVLIIGMGSNLLVRDKGIRGIVIKIGHNLKQIAISNQEIYAEAGVRLSQLAKEAAVHSLQGLEFAEGIPGSLGGAIFMNAGAYGGEMKDVLAEVIAIDYNGKDKIFMPEDMQLGYRQSVFQQNDYIILAAKMQLKSGNREEIINCMKDYASKRREKQPLEYPSAGSTFKRPEGYYVGPMVEKMGLKGFRIGGAEVSPKHAGFIVNTGNATAEDVLQLIEYIKVTAQQKFGVDLEPELRIVGEE